MSQEIYPFVSSVKINSLENFCQWIISITDFTENVSFIYPLKMSGNLVF